MNALTVSITVSLVCASLLWPTVATGPASAEAPAPFPALLSETGYLKDTARHLMAADFHGYEVNAAPWADGAEKHRFMRLPPGKSLTWKSEGPWDVPVGTVLLQTLVFPIGEAERRLETRVLEVTPDGNQFATYIWREDQQDAERTTRGGELGVEWDDGYLLWTVTPTVRCQRCHNPDSGAFLGLNTAQLDKADQVKRLADKGLLSGAPTRRASWSKLVDPWDTSLPLEARARSYLAANCSPCHRPEGKGSGLMDLRHHVPRSESGLGHYKEVLLEGRPMDSWIYLRMIYNDRRKMPGVLTSHTDERGADLIRDWVESLAP